MKKPRKNGRLKERGGDLSLLNLRVTAADRRALNAAAKKYTNGNLSEWLRLAGTRYRIPKYGHSD